MKTGERARIIAIGPVRHCLHRSIGLSRLDEGKAVGEFDENERCSSRLSNCRVRQ